MAEPAGDDAVNGTPADEAAPPGEPAPGGATVPHGEAVPAHALVEADPGWFNVPNLLTFLRAMLVPVILWLLAGEDVGATERWWALGIFVFAAATDSVDGWVARRWHGVTRWGQLADPIADKLLIIGSLASLALVGDLPWWAVNVIVAREVAITLLRVRLVTRLDLVMAASVWGKAKTVSQVVAVAAYLLPGLSATGRWWLLNLAVLLTVWSGIEYAFRAGRLARLQRREREGRR